ncbi:MAG: hypothetical protein CFE27_08730 [Alphaproteobacteria bacterium PA1]|nr:MAG: hypothetical protein CFE27_08730 [Alphaproteobacteria bacterium PA1]
MSFFDIANTFLNNAYKLVLIPFEFLFGQSWVAPLLLLPSILIWATIIAGGQRKKVKAYKKEAAARLSVLRSALDQLGGPDEAQLAFSAKYDEIDRAFSSVDPGGEQLAYAWREFQESIVRGERGTVVRNTVRPIQYFARTAPSQAQLAFWSNMFVGIGLVLTFLGIVVALNKAGAGLSGNLDQAKLALTELLAVAGAKFSTSIAGVSASLLLRYSERRNSRECQHLIDELCEWLERGLLYVPPQRLAVEQLDIQNQQLAQLKQFNTDLALQIGEKFQVAIAPVTASLGMLNENIASMSEGLGQGAAKAVAEASGGELRALGQTLANLGEQLSSMGSTVGASGNEAAQQIRLAGADFAQAAADIRGAFERLSLQVDGMGDKLLTQAQAASEAQSEALRRAGEISESAQQAASQSISGAVQALSGAAVAASSEFQAGLGKALAEGAAASQEVFKAALEESGAGLRESAARISAAIQGAAGQIERAATGLEAGSSSMERGLKAFADTSTEARTAAQALEGASRAFGVAAQPVSQAAQAIASASERLQRLFEESQTNQDDVLAEMKVLATAIRETQDSARKAWQDYQTRFEGVDKSLENAGGKFAETIGESLDSFRKFSADTDKEMASAVGKMGKTLDQIEDYAGTLSEFVEALRRAEGNR